MRVTRLRLSNFLPYEELDVDFSQSPQLAVVGQVGHGKSSLLDAVLWAVYGQGRASADSMIRKGADEARVGVDMIVRGKIVSVTRSRRRDRATSLTLDVDGENKTRHTIDETQETINRLIGVPIDGLLAGPIMVQGRSDELMRLPASERKDMLARLFGLDQYERYLARAKQRRELASEIRTRAEAVMTEIERQLEVKPDLVRRLDRLEGLEESYLDRIEAGQSIVNARREEAAALIERERLVNSHRQTLATLQTSLSVNDRGRREVGERKERLLAQAATIEVVPCGGEGIYATCPLLALAFKAKDEVATISYDELDQEYNTIAHQLEITEADLEEAEAAGGQIEAAKQALMDADSDLIKTRRELEAVTADRIRLTSELDAIASAEARQKEVLGEYNVASQDFNVYSVLCEAFHRNGIPSMILTRSLPIIEAEANRVLARMPQGMQIQLLTQRETKAKTIRETLDVAVTVAGHAFAYGLLSGGERFRVDFALRLGIASVLAQRSGAPIDTLWLDEGWGTQDAEGREAMLEAIAAVSGRFGLIVLVTHLPEVTDRMPARLEVRKQEGISHAQLVS